MLAAGAAALGVATWMGRDLFDGLLPAAREPREVLSAQELDELVLLSAVLFEPEDERQERELATTIRWWAGGRTSRGPHGHLYRDGLAALATASRDNGQGRTFVALAPTERAALVTSLLDRDEDAPFRALASELLYGIYSSAPGWRSLGYVTWPGVPSPALEYTRRPEAAEGLAAAIPRLRVTV